MASFCTRDNEAENSAVLADDGCEFLSRGESTMRWQEKSNRTSSSASAAVEDGKNEGGSGVTEKE